MPYFGVSSLFEGLVRNTQLSSAQYADASGKHGRVRAALNEAYYGHSSSTLNSFLVGSYGKNTEISPPSDVDILFELPSEVYDRFIRRMGNTQSQLLQDVKGHLDRAFKSTRVRADGPIISVPFVTYAIEVLPAFRQTLGGYLHADSNGGGSWRKTDPVTEREQLVASNSETGGKTIHLIKIAKAWKLTKNVKIKSVILELIAKTFLDSWGHRDTGGYGYYDFMVRDFFQQLPTWKNRFIYLPGMTLEQVYTGDAWEAQANYAYSASVRATSAGADDDIWKARSEWRSIFGNYVPLI